MSSAAIGLALRVNGYRGESAKGHELAKHVSDIEVNGGTFAIGSVGGAVGQGVP